MKTLRQTIRRSRKAQSLIEFAFGALLLVLLLAAAVDFGRAFYTYVVVQNMAGEAASFLAGQPDNDYTSGHYAGPDNNTFQFRARNVAARVMGAIINPNNVNINSDPNPRNGTDVWVDVAQPSRCAGTPFTVTVRYHIQDLFFPAFLGMNEITVGGSEQTYFATSTHYQSPLCPTPTSPPQ